MAGKRRRLFTLQVVLILIKHPRRGSAPAGREASAERGLGRRQVSDREDEAVVLEALDARLADGRQQVRKADGAELVQRQVFVEATAEEVEWVNSLVDEGQEVTDTLFLARRTR